VREREKERKKERKREGERERERALWGAVFCSSGAARGNQQLL
jgi:hypothetical protein